MVKQDILRSLASRIEMHCESLIEEEQGTQAQLDEGTTRVYHEVPRRVFANLLGSKLRVSDYLFPGKFRQSHKSLACMVHVFRISPRAQPLLPITTLYDRFKAILQLLWGKDYQRLKPSVVCSFPLWNGSENDKSCHAAFPVPVSANSSIVRLYSRVGFAQ